MGLQNPDRRFKSGRRLQSPVPAPASEVTPVPDSTTRTRPPSADPAPQSSTSRCSTCYGEGTVFHDYGPQLCTDCCGLGELPPASVLSERRLRELEQRYEHRDEETWRDV